MMEINFDAPISGSSYVGLGVVLHDEKGSIIAAATRRVMADWGAEMGGTN